MSPFPPVQFPRPDFHRLVLRHYGLHTPHPFFANWHFTRNPAAWGHFVGTSVRSFGRVISAFAALAIRIAAVSPNSILSSGGPQSPSLSSILPKLTILGIQRVRNSTSSSVIGK